jgi:Chitobiase/beta-hexosaminidase C-terminal domain
MAGRLLCAWLMCCCTSLLVNALSDSNALANVADTRRLVAAVPVIVPPGTKAHHHPVGITLTAGPGDVVFYTVDGSLPNRTSAFVQSGQYVVVSANSTVRAMAAPSATVVSQHCFSDVANCCARNACMRLTIDITFFALQILCCAAGRRVCCSN